MVVFGRLFFQNPQLDIVVNSWTAGRGWSVPQFDLNIPIPRTPLSAASWYDSSWHIRLYYGADGSPNLIKDYVFEGTSWSYGQFQAPCIPGSQVGATCLNANDLRVYLQNGTYTTAISEWCAGDSSTPGITAIPPA